MTVDWFIQSADISLLLDVKNRTRDFLESGLALCVCKRKSLGASLNQDLRKKFRIKGSYVKIILVPLMLLTAGLLMSFAWIGHLKFKSWNFLTALAVSWLLVLPEYILNVFSVRWGRDVFSGAQMAAIHLGSGVLWVTLIAKLYLGETFSWSQGAGFALMGIAIGLILIKF